MGYAGFSAKKFLTALPRAKPGSAWSGIVGRRGWSWDKLRLTSDFPQEIVALPFAFGCLVARLERSRVGRRPSINRADDCVHLPRPSVYL